MVGLAKAHPNYKVVEQDMPTVRYNWMHMLTTLGAIKGAPLCWATTIRDGIDTGD